MKKFIISIVVLIILLVMGLFLLTRISDSYSLAKATIERSEMIASTAGPVRFTVLLGARYNLQPKSVSCGSLIFLVKGDRESEIIEVLVRKENFHGTWTVYDLVLGMTNRSEKSCLAGTSNSPS